MSVKNSILDLGVGGGDNLGTHLDRKLLLRWLLTPPPPPQRDVWHNARRARCERWRVFETPKPEYNQHGLTTLHQECNLHRQWHSFPLSPRMPKKFTLASSKRFSKLSLPGAPDLDLERSHRAPRTWAGDNSLQWLILNYL